MPISIRTLQEASTRHVTAESTIFTTDQARTTAFLCHSHKDGTLVKGLLNLFQEEGWHVYVDWKDDRMPEEPTLETAKRIQAKIVKLDYFLFLATPDSTLSR